MATKLNDSHQWTIALRPKDHEKPRRITTLASLGGDGFSAVLPCHKTKTGYLFKQPVIPEAVVPRFVSWETANAFGKQDRVKLIYHKDGFAEFSSEGPGRITASRDLISGEVKGLGLFSAPLSRPGVGGPILAVTVYGIDQFEIAKERDRVIVFEPSDFYYRGCTPENANSWVLAIYAFPQNTIPPIRLKQKRPMIAVTLEPLNGPIASVLELATLFLPAEKMFLGLYVYRANAKLQSESGWIFHGPGDYTRDRRGKVLMGIYPRTEIPWGEKS
jgi:hypothetical protein